MTWESMIILSALAALIPLSYLVEAFRTAPAAPDRLDWAPEIPIRYVDLDGTKLRYITAGQGPALVLLHTLRTQLDMFQKVIPELAHRFRVYALDFPGHGFSDIPKTQYSAELFVTATTRFLDQLDIRDAVVAGESIGGTVALLLAARRNPRVRSVVAINPYDYAGGRGIRRSSLLANILFGLNNVPVLGSTVTRLRLYPIVKRVLKGGVYRKGALPSALARALYRVGNRRGHYRAFMSLVRRWASWERARVEYAHVDRPVLLIYGDHDWSRVAEREADRQAIPGAEPRIIKDAGHFLSLDAPRELVQAVVSFAERPALASSPVQPMPVVATGLHTPNTGGH
jgi:pimeloyl-ACP methyl ester carboxylesterase